MKCYFFQLQAEAKVPVVGHRGHFLFYFRIKSCLVSPMYHFVVLQHPQLAAQNSLHPPPQPPGVSVHCPALTWARSGHATSLQVLGAYVAVEASGRGEPLTAL